MKLKYIYFTFGILIFSNENLTHANPNDYSNDYTAPSKAHRFYGGVDTQMAYSTRPNKTDLKSLVDLPNELLEEIGAFFEFDDLANLYRTHVNTSKALEKRLFQRQAKLLDTLNYSATETSEKIKIIKILGNSGLSNPSITKGLTEILLTHPNEKVRAEAANSLGKISPNGLETQMVLVKALEDEHYLVKLSASNAFENIRFVRPEVLAELVRLAQRFDFGAVRALGKAKPVDTEIHKMLAKFTKVQKIEERYGFSDLAANALANIKPTDPDVLRIIVENLVFYNPHFSYGSDVVSVYNVKCLIAIQPTDPDLLKKIIDIYMEGYSNGDHVSNFSLFGPIFGPSNANQPEVIQHLLQKLRKFEKYRDQKEELLQILYNIQSGDVVKLKDLLREDLLDPTVQNFLKRIENPEFITALGKNFL